MTQLTSIYTYLMLSCPRYRPTQPVNQHQLKWFFLMCTPGKRAGSMWECVCAARVVCHCAYWDDVSRCRNGPLTYAVVVDTRRAHVRLFTPMPKEIFKCIQPRAHCEHLENDTLLLLTHAPALIISTIKARPHLMLLIIIACKENY